MIVKSGGGVGGRVVGGANGQSLKKINRINKRKFIYTIIYEMQIIAIIS